METLESPACPSASRSLSGGGGGTMCVRVGNKHLKPNAGCTTIAPSLPWEIIEIIISNLSVKFLLRCQCVSKSLHSAICSPNFREVIGKSWKPDLRRLFVFSDHIGFHFFKLEKGRLEEEVLYKLPSVHERCTVKCNCDGLILLLYVAQSEPNYYLLWNPSIRKLRKFDLPPDVNVGDCRSRGSGICYDGMNGDYKIVFLSFGDKYFVYSCKTNIWSLKDSIYGYSRIIGFPSEGFSVGGAIYWFNVSLLHKYLLKFDSKDDELHLLQMPEGIVRLKDCGIYLDSLRGSLCLWAIPRCRGKRPISCWMMRDDLTWNNLIMINYSRIDIPLRICFTNEGKDILIAPHRERLETTVQLYSVVKKKYRRIGHLPKGFSARCLIPCVDNLHFPPVEGQLIDFTYLD